MAAAGANHGPKGIALEALQAMMGCWLERSPQEGSFRHTLYSEAPPINPTGDIVRSIARGRGPVLPSAGEGGLKAAY